MWWVIRCEISDPCHFHIAKIANTPNEGSGYRYKVKAAVGIARGGNSTAKTAVVANKYKNIGFPWLG